MVLDVCLRPLSYDNFWCSSWSRSFLSQSSFPTSCFQLVKIHNFYHCPVGKEPLENFKHSSMGSDLSFKNQEVEGQSVGEYYNCLPGLGPCYEFMNQWMKPPCYFRQCYWCARLLEYISGCWHAEVAQLLRPSFSNQLHFPSPTPIPPCPASLSS